MTQSKARAIWSLCIWGGVLCGFLPLFFLSGGGVRSFSTDSSRIAMTSVLFAIGFALYFLMMARTRVRPGKIVKDERDEHIAGHSNGVTLVVVLVYVYAITIMLWVWYQKQEVVPAGWMWFVAYSDILCGYVAHSVSTLILDARTSGHAEA